jgi:hypothetical protein
MEQDSTALREYASLKTRAHQYALQNNAYLEQARFPRVF